MTEINNPVCTEYPNENVKNAIEEIARNENFIQYHIETEGASSKGDGYMGEMFRIKLFGTRKDQKEQMLPLIVKNCPNSIENNKILQLKDFFHFEVFAYNDIIPVLEKIQEDAGVAEEDRFLRPKCYKTCDEDKKELLVLEDLCVSGYRLVDMQKPLDFDHAALAFKKIAALHATAFALKKKNPEMFDKFSEKTSKTIELWNGFDKFVDIFLKKAVSQMDDDDLAKRLAAFGEGVYKKMEKLIGIGNEDPYYILCHGDCWVNNFMFKYEDDSPINMQLIDWQVIRYASPITDLAHLIFPSTEEDFRAEYLDQLFQLYYDTLGQRLLEMGLHINDCFPPDEFKRHLKEYLPYGLIISLYTIPFVHMDPKDAMDVVEIMHFNFDNGNFPTKTSEGSLRCIRGVVRDFKKFGLI